jgi:hypothetical protein
MEATGPKLLRELSRRRASTSTTHPLRVPLRGEAAAARVTDEDLRSGVRSFIDDLARRAMSDYDCDVHGLLRRVQAGPSR